MQIIEINRDNAEKLFDYWNKIGKDLPYFYSSGYKAFIKSLFDDIFQGMAIFRDNIVFIVEEDDHVKGFIQYGIPRFSF